MFLLNHVSVQRSPLKRYTNTLLVKTKQEILHGENKTSISQFYTSASNAQLTFKMNRCLIFCQALALTITLVQYQIIKEVGCSIVAAEMEPSEVGTWFTSVERKLNDMVQNIYQGVKTSVERFKTWEPLAIRSQPKGMILLNKSKDLINKNKRNEINEKYEGWISYDTYKKQIEEKLKSQTEVRNETVPGESSEENLDIPAEPASKPRPIKKKKIKKTEKKSTKMKPKRMRAVKATKMSKKKQHLKKKQRMKTNHFEPQNKPDPKYNYSENIVKGKPVDIIVHIKMNE